MDFKRLRLSGFKSFVEPTNFEIMGGLTGIVGPNGCGKSNLLESLRWVMGETSYKSMRGAAMADVIFSGTAGRPSRNHAEVVLYLDNSARTASAEFNDSDEIEVSRRIERDAGSAYRINGRDVRARDVQLLFADASTGARSNSLVRQGQIGELISAKPETRRRVLEEAAGISGLHSRRHEAELRLRAAQNNLEKLDEEIGRLETQYRSLKRQARQAGRYKEISGQIRATEAMALYLRWQQAATRLEETQTQLKAAQAEVANANAGTARAATDLATAQEALPALRNKEAEAAAALRRLTLEREAMDNELQAAQDMLGRLAEQANTIEEDRKREAASLIDAEQQLVRLGEEEQQAQNSISAEENEAEAAALARTEQEQAKLQTADAAFDEANRGVAEQGARIAGLRDALTANGAQEQRLNAELTKMQTARKDIEGKLGQDFDLAAREAELGELETILADAAAAHDTQKQNYNAALAAHEAARAPMQEASALLARLIGERDALAQLQKNADVETFEPVLNQINVQAGYETALGAALGDDLEAALDKAAPAYWDMVAGATPLSPLPQGATPLADFVSGAEALSRRLSQIGVVENAEAGARLQASLVAGQRLVSRAGDIWRWDGYCRTAAAETNATQRLAQKRRLETLQAEIAKAQSGAEASEADASRQRTALDEARIAYDAAQQNVQSAQQRVSTCRQELAQAEAGAATNQAKINALESAVARLQTECATTHTARQDMERALRELEADDKSVGLEDKRAAVAQARSALAEAHADWQNWRSRREARDEQLQRIRSERASWTQRQETAHKQLQTLATRRHENSREVAKFESIPAKIEQDKPKIADAIAAAEQTRTRAADILAEAENAMAGVDKAHRETQTQLSTAREEQARLEARKEAGELRLEEATSRIHDVLQIAPQEALALAEHDADAPLPEVETLETQLEKLRRERETLGGVNLQADSEAEEIGTQVETMKAERDDLASAVNKLRHGIGQLNREGRQRLLAAFELVNGHFERLFTRLFGGGTAKLELTESDDPLEAGLEILAHPPGKRPQHMSLLSGGEQALTAVALIFAVFLTNPSPICVLDEVDAPLDDSNVDRFCALLHDITEETGTRFLVITHHALTMARMNRLFGVTMQERGISQLLSVNLETAEQYAEAGRGGASEEDNEGGEDKAREAG